MAHVPCAYDRLISITLWSYLFPFNFFQENEHVRVVF